MEEQKLEINQTVSEEDTEIDAAASPAPLLPPCRVCGEKASGFHYGANTCSPCKGFFRRSIVKIQHKGEEYVCKGRGGKCPIKPGKPVPCPSCRYKQCIDVGMSQEGIITGRYTYEKKTRDTQEVKKLQHGTVNSTLNEVDISDEEAEEVIRTLEEANARSLPILFEENLLENLSQIQQSIYDQYKARTELFGEMACISSEVYEDFYRQTGIPLDNREELMKQCFAHFQKSVKAMLEIVRSIPGFKELTLEDQTNLIKASHLEFMFLTCYKTVNVELNVVSNDLKVHKNDLHKLFQFSEHVEEIFYYSKTLHALGLTEEELLLTRCIAIMSRDRCLLDDPEKVERIQWKLLNCLRWVALKHNMNPNERLRRIVDRLTALRNIPEKRQKEQKLDMLEANALLIHIIGLNQSKEIQK